MFDFEYIAEAKIREAIIRGEFDNLPGSGKPVDLTEYFSVPAELRAGFDLLKKHGVRPREVDLLKEIYDLKEERKSLPDSEDKSNLEIAISEKTTELNILMAKYKRR